MAWARALRRSHERFFGSLDGDSDERAQAQRRRKGIRSVIAASWRRSARAGVVPDGAAAPVVDDGELARRRELSGLEPALPVLRDLLGGHAREAHHLMIVTDADGHLLWVEGDHATRIDAERISLVPGAFWGEEAAGTNAMGTALAVDHAVQIFAAEHVRNAAHGWTCAAAPVHHPVTGALLGSIDLTGPARTVHPHSLALVTAAALAAGSVLPRDLAVTQSALRLHALGREQALIEIAGRRVELSRRHSEIVVLLALHPEGLSTEQLALELFGDAGKPVSVRAEFSRLRRLLGSALDAQPYRLTVPVVADVLAVRERIAAGKPGAALRAYSGPLLPGSEAPGIAEARAGIDAGLRATVLQSGDDALLQTWLESPGGTRDLPALELLLRRRPRDPALAGLGRRAVRQRNEMD